jgi:hypothetical protein
MSTNSWLHDRLQSLKREDGFAFSVTAIGLVLILGLITFYLSSSVTARISIAADFLETTQSYYNAISGIEYALEEMGTNINNVVGTYEHGNGTVTLSTSAEDFEGDSLSCEGRRIISTGNHGETERMMELVVEFHLQGGDPWGNLSMVDTLDSHEGGDDDDEEDEDCGDKLWGKDHKVSFEFCCDEVDINSPTKITKIKLWYVSGGSMTVNNPNVKSGTWSVPQGEYLKKAKVWRKKDHGNGTKNTGEVTSDIYSSCGAEKKFDIKKHFTLNDSLFMGFSVEVDDDADIGDPPGNPTNISVPAGYTVDGNFDQYFTWSIYPNPVPTLPVISTTPYDSLIAIAASITHTSGNKVKGDLNITGGTLDLSQYANRTLFVKGKVKLKGSYVTGGVFFQNGLALPGILVATEDIETQQHGNNNTEVNDNIIFISNKKIKLKQETQFGKDHSALPVADWPVTFNELYANEKIEIEGDSQVWAQCTGREGIKLQHSTVYGVLYVPTGRLEWVGGESEGDDDDDDDDGSSSDARLYGALFVKAVKNDKLDHGIMNLFHIYPRHYFTSRWKYDYVALTWREI